MNPRRLHDMREATHATLWAHASADPEMVGWNDRSVLPNIAAGYYITGSYDVLLYAGQTTNLRDRFARHHRLPTLLRVLDEPYTYQLTINYCPVEPEILPIAEKKMIAAGHPPLNNTPRDTAPVFLGAWLSHELWQQLEAYAKGLGGGRQTEVDISTCVAHILHAFLA